MTPGWILHRDIGAKINKSLGLPRMICFYYACVRKECENDLCVGVHLDFHNELSKEEQNFFKWWVGFNPNVMII